MILIVARAIAKLERLGHRKWLKGFKMRHKELFEVTTRVHRRSQKIENFQVEYVVLHSRQLFDINFLSTNTAENLNSQANRFFIYL